jgi:transposase
LCHPYRTWHQREIAAAAHLSVGTIHALARRLESERHLAREGKGRTQKIHLTRPDVLLDDWAQWWRSQHVARYAFHSEHPSAYARMSALYAAASQIGFSFESSDRASPEQDLSPLIFTGLAGASLVVPYADFDVVTAYVSHDISGLARKAGLNYVETAPNVLLLAAPDRGIFYDTRWINGYPVACLPQLYADLLAIGARAAGEVAPLVRDQILRENGGRITDFSM